MKRHTAKPSSRIEGEFKAPPVAELKDFWKDVTLVLNRMRDKINDVESDLGEHTSKESYLTPAEAKAINDSISLGDITPKIVGDLLVQYSKPEDVAAIVAPFLEENTGITEEKVNLLNNALRNELIKIINDLKITSDKHLVLPFLNPSGTWTATHNLGFKPTVNAFDENWCLIDTLWEHISNDQLVAKFHINTTGYLVLS
jgi:hypothetical protein